MSALTRYLCSVSNIWRVSYRQVGSPSYVATRLHGNHHHDHHHDDHHHHGKLYAQHLTKRGLIEICGGQSAEFLQGLVSNNITHLDRTEEISALYAGMLNAQGRLLYDLIIYKMDKSSYWVECDQTIIEDLMRTLKRHRLRKKIDIEDMTEGLKIWSLFRDITETEIEVPDFIDEKFNLAFVTDPRLRAFGWRLILPEHTRMENTVRNAVEVINDDLYTTERYKIGIAEGVDELLPGKSLPLESNFNFLHGVSFIKGCFVGQELTARTFNTGVTRKRLMPIEFKSPVPNVGAKIRANDKDIGTIRAVRDRHGLALVRISNLTSRSVHVVDGDVSSEAVVNIPPWWPLGDDEFKKVGFSLT